MRTNIERAILSTFLWANDIGMDTDDAFILDISLFTGDRRLIASMVNEQTRGEKYYSLLNMEIENTSTIEWLEISNQTPLSFSVAKRYQDKLQELDKDNILKYIS